MRVWHMAGSRRWSAAALLMVGVFSTDTAAQSARGAARALRVSPAPTVRIAPSEQPDQLIEILAGATRLANGQIVVGNRGDYALYLYDSAGRFLRRTARKGSGPGEVQALGLFHRCGPYVHAHELTANKTVVFGTGGEYLRTFRLPELPYRSTCNANGTYGIMSWETTKSVPQGAHRNTVHYWLTRGDTARGVSLGMHPGSERYSNNLMVLGREPRLALSRDRAFIALADSLHVLVFDMNGTPLPALHAPWKPQRVTDADVDAYIERMVALYGEEMRKLVTTEVKAMPRPSTLPATLDLLADSEGLVWVQSFPSASSPTVIWTVFAPTGAVVARVPLPTGLTVFEVGRDYLLGAITDPDTGLSEIVVHALQR